RPVGLYLGPLLMAMLLVFPRGLPARKRILRALVFPIVLAVALTPWIARNAGVSRDRGFSAAGDYVLYFYTAGSVEAKVEHKGLTRMQEEFGFGGLPYVKNEAYLQKHPEQRTWSLGQIIQFWHSETRKIFREHSFSFVMVHVRGSVTLLLDPGI